MKTSRNQGLTETPIFTCTFCNREIEYDWYGLQRDEEIRFMWCPYDLHKAYEEGVFDTEEGNGGEVEPPEDDLAIGTMEIGKTFKIK